MTRLIATWPRRFALALLLFLLAFALATILAWQAEQAHPDSIPPEHLMTRLFTLPALLATAFLLLSSAAAMRPAQAAPTPAAPLAQTPPEPFVAQVVGIQWLNPLIRRDYPTEWQLLWTLGITGPNKNDDMVRVDPKSFTSIQPIASIVSNMYQRKSFRSFYLQYMEEMFRPIGRRYAINPKYFYTVQPKSPKKWRELAGIHVEFAIPATAQLDPAEAAEIARARITKEFEIGGSPLLSSRATPPDVRITAGGANAGFTSLGAALDHLAAHPDETVWAMNWDAPDFPLDEQMTENCVLLVLAGPKFDTQREPLAWVGRPAVRAAEDFELRPGEPRAVQAWRAALAAAATNAARPLAEVGYVIHDAGRAGDAAGARLALLGHALTEPLPELDLMKRSFNTPALLGELRAGSALTNVALAVAYAHHRGTPVLVAGTTEPGIATALVVTPPARARLIGPDKDWFRARGEGSTYLPWWGLRRDENWSTYMQGFSE